MIFSGCAEGVFSSQEPRVSFPLQPSRCPFRTHYDSVSLAHFMYNDEAAHVAVAAVLAESITSKTTVALLD